jgi:cytochrome c-type biogenesis protein
MDPLAIYIAGLLSFFSPCVLPIIPVYFSILLEDKAFGWKHLLPRGLVFCAGFTIIFSTLGLGAGKLGALIPEHRGTISLAAGVILLLIGLKLMDVITIPFLDKSYSINVSKFKTKFRLLNAFILGLLFALIWSPCIGPVLGGILTYVSVKSMNPLDGAFKLFVFSTGISTPLILSIFFLDPIMKFTRNNKYFILTLQKVLGAVLILFALSLFGNVTMLADRPDTPSGADKIICPDKLPLFISMISFDCETCQDMLPVIKELKDNCDGKVIEFRTINVADPEYAYAVYKLGMLGTPTYVLMDTVGKESQRFMGYQTKEELDKAIFKMTGKKCLN